MASKQKVRGFTEKNDKASRRILEIRGEDLKTGEGETFISRMAQQIL